jgi:O-antigen/teichoic acid export membrane protein
MIKKLQLLYQNNLRIKQVVSLLAVNVFIIPLSFVSNVIITRFLGPVAFGDFKFILYVFNFSLVLFNFGFFQAGNRALVLNSDPEKTREYYGSMLVILIGLFLVIGLVLFGYALVDKNINEKGLRTMLICIIPFAWVFLLITYFEVLFQADNKIGLLAKSRLYPKIIFFISILILFLFFSKYQGNRLTIIWIFFLLTQIIGFFYIIYKINPSFRNLRPRIKEIWIFNKTYGINVYLGSLFSTGSSTLSGLLIGYFGINNSGVGFYSLALTITEPLGFIPNVIATTHYKDFSTKTSIPKKLILITVSVTLSALVLCWILVGPFIKYFYGPEFQSVIGLTFIVSFGVIMSGFADFFNRFLGSHGQGKALRNSSIIVGLFVMVFNISLIPLFGETGAAYTLILSSLIYILTMLWFYRRLVSNLAKNSLKVED